MQLTANEVMELLPEKDYKGEVKDGVRQALKEFNTINYYEASDVFLYACEDKSAWNRLAENQKARVQELKKKVEKWAENEKVEYVEVPDRYNTFEWNDHDIYIEGIGCQRTRRKLIPRVFNFAALLRKWENVERIKDEEKALSDDHDRQRRRKELEKEEFRKREVEIRACQAKEHVVEAAESFIS
jgi:hypothetical protein